VSKKYNYEFFQVLFVLMSLSTVMSASTPQWKVDQNNGNYWGSDGKSLMTHDPYDNNPGTLQIIPSPEGYEIRIYPDIPFPDNGQTRVRFTFSDGSGQQMGEFESWPITLEQGVFGYVEVPRDFTSTFIKEGINADQVIVEIEDRYGELARRTFIFRDYQKVYNQLSSDVKVLPEPKENGKYDVTFNVTPPNASVTIFDENCFFGCSRFEEGKGTGSKFTVELSEGGYLYVSQLRDYVKIEEHFEVPQDLTVDITMKPPSGFFRHQVEGGVVSEAIYGEGWPFTARKGALMCNENRGVIFYASNGKKYALNERAEAEHPKIDMLIDPEYYDDYNSGKIDLTWLRDRALSLCDK